MTLRLTCLLLFLLTGISRADVITIQLKWHHQFQFAGYYVALHRGYYKEEGLDVRLVAGKPHLQPVDQVMQGKADYGVAASSVLLARAKGQPLVIVAPIFQHSPSVLISLAKNNIRNPTDLKGRRIMLPGGVADAEIITMLLRQGVDPSEVNILTSSYNLEDLITGRVDAYHGYATNEPFFLEEKGIAYNVMEPKRFGVDFYGDMLFTSTRETIEHPERVSAVRRATLRGWHYALDHPESTIQLIRDHYRPDKTPEHLRFEADRMGSLIMRDVVELGHVNLERLQSMADDLVTTGLVDKRITVSDMVFREPESPSFTKLWLPFLATVAGSAVLISVLFWQQRRRLTQCQSSLQRLKQQLQEQKTLDSHTGLLHRQEIMRRIDKTRRRGMLLLLRMTGLKQLNRRLGCQVCDEIVRQACRVIRQQARRSDLVGRFTSNSVLIFLPEASHEEAEELAKRIKELLSLLPLAETNSPAETFEMLYACTAYEPGESLDERLPALEDDAVRQAP